MFKKFNSIENSYQKKWMDKLRSLLDHPPLQHVAAQLPLDAQTWVATEKIHGANFSFWIDRSTIKYGKRTGYLSEDESFYDYSGPRNELDPIFRKMFNEYIAIDSAIERIVIYGELYGGNIQCQIKYGPIRFIAFDMVLEYPDRRRFLSKTDLATAARQYGFPVVKILEKGTMEELLCIDVETLTTSYSDTDPNQIAEGIVIQPNEPRYLHNGKRAIIKKKSAKFAEKMGLKAPKPTPSPSTGATLDPEARKYVDDVSQYMTENRLVNLMTKIGPQPNTKHAYVVGMFMQDILKDYAAENESDHGFTKKQLRPLNSLLSQMASRLVITMGVTE